jgi:protein tyrosine phosphatase (PTP) superfamily phosphohydrolase (DUF442 family)
MKKTILYLAAYFVTVSCTHTFVVHEKMNAEGYSYNSMQLNYNYSNNSSNATTKGGNFSVKSEKAYLYIGGQPNEIQLKRIMDDEGVNVVVNLRNEDEMEGNLKDFENHVKKLGAKYHILPVMNNGNLNEKMFSNVESVIQNHHKNGERILIHCASGNRAAAWLATHLKFQKDQSTKEALNIAIEAGLTDTEYQNQVKEILNRNKSR